MQNTRYKADRKVDRLYAGVRNKYGTDNPRANGYRLQTYFLREQETILGELNNSGGTVLDIACGSGLMLQPLLESGQNIVGIDFNDFACQSARYNNINVIRGDAYIMPFGAETINQAISCQFLNQQPCSKINCFLKEVFRILKHNGELILVWRNDRALIHRVALFIYRYIDKFTGIPEFPYFNHTIDAVSQEAEEVGFITEKKQLTFPLMRWKTGNIHGLAAKIIGASCFLVLKKHDDGYKHK